MWIGRSAEPRQFIEVGARLNFLSETTTIDSAQLSVNPRYCQIGRDVVFWCRRFGTGTQENMCWVRARGSGLQARGRLATFVVTVAIVSACAPPPIQLDPPPVAPGVGPVLPGPGLRVQGGIEQISVSHATAGEVVRVVGPLGSSGAVTVERVADRLGSVVVRDLRQGATYRVEHPASGTTTDVRVLVASEHPDPSFYRATALREGLNYMPMRDGTLLAATVRPPFGASLADGPFPTVIEYSGYDVAAPADPIVARLGGALGLNWSTPLVPGGETLLGNVVARVAGYAVVSVQLRGTGCSGGDADLLDLIGAADGYDAVETVAAQWWAQGGRIGMVGISFSGFSQLATAATRPPHLAAIAPFSFSGRLWDVAWPGGVRNIGFAETWLSERQRDAQPAPADGAHPSANALVATDPYCRENQLLHGQVRDGVAEFRASPTLTDIYTRRDFVAAMDHVDVPVFGALQFHDQESGSTPMRHIERLTSHNDRVWLTFSAGRHNDSISPDTMVDLFQFLDLYVAQRTPEIKPGLYLLAPLMFGTGHADLPLPSLFGLSYADARHRWEQRPTFRFAFERSTTLGKGSSGPRWSFDSAAFPPAGSVAQRWYLGPGGALSATVPATGSDAWVSDPTRRPDTIGNAWSTVAPGAGLGFVSAPLDRTTTVVGPVSADLWISSSASDTDLQVTLSEVRPDGSEMLVATGVQRASQRFVDPTLDSALEPGHTFVNPAPLEPGTNLVRVQVLPTGHAFRAGSRIRLTVGPTGGDREAWRFASVDLAAPPTNTLRFGGVTASSVVLPVVTGVAVPAGIPACPQAGQPCRQFIAAANGG